MNFQQLETFRWVAALGSFTKAAEKLNTTQSTVSMRISALEDELGVQLLDRTQRHSRLTHSGRQLLHHATEIHAQVTELKANIAGPETITGVIRIAVAELIALTWLPDLVSQMARLYPKIKLELEVGLSGDIRDRVTAGEADFGMLPGDGHFGIGLNSTLLGQIDFAFMAAPAMGVPEAELTPCELSNWPVISLGPRSFLSDLQENWFLTDNVKANKQNRSNSMEISAGLARSGLGVALLPVRYYANDITAGRLRRLAVNPALPMVLFYGIHTAANYSPIIRKVIEIAENMRGFD